MAEPSTAPDFTVRGEEVPALEGADEEDRRPEKEFAFDASSGPETLVRASGSPFGNLPVEVACRIFGLCIPLYRCADISSTTWGFDTSRTEPFQYTIGAVCRSWYRVVWSNPQFWTSIIIRPRQSTSASQFKFWEQWLARTGQLPLTVRLRFRRERCEVIKEDAVSRVMKPVIAILNSVAHRLSVFLAEIPTCFVEQLRLQAQRATVIQTLVLQPRYAPGVWSDLHDGVWDLGIEPSPKELSIKGFRLQNVHIQWHNLTNFAGTSMVIQDCLQLLRQCPVLRECTLNSILELEDLAPSSSHSVIHPRLKSLTLEDPTPTSILRYLTLPSLKTLSCWLGPEECFSDVLAPFVTKSGCRLLEATFGGSAEDDEDLLTFLELIPFLRDLELTATSLDYTLFERLGDTAYIDIEDFPHFLPLLKRFSFNGTRYFSWRDVASMAPIEPPDSRPGLYRRPLYEIDLMTDSFGDDHDDDELFPDQATLEKILAMYQHGVSVCICDDQCDDVIESGVKKYGLVDPRT